MDDTPASSARRPVLPARRRRVNRWSFVRRAGVLRPAGLWSRLSAYAAGTVVLALGLPGGAALPLFAGELAIG
jgi:hypothetical protein